MVAGRSVTAVFDGGALTSDAGALLLGATDRTIRLVERFATCFSDGRDAARIEHTVATLVGQWVIGIALGGACPRTGPDPGEDRVDHDQLRHDPVMAVLTGKLEARRAGYAPFAGKSTLNQLEHAPVGSDRYRKVGHDRTAIERLLVELFLDAHRTPPKRIVLDLDATDDPLHGPRKAASSTATEPALRPAKRDRGDCYCTCRCMSSAAGICWRPG